MKNEPDAIVGCKNNKLYFKDLNKISTIFHNIFYLYKEANNKEIKDSIVQINSNNDLSMFLDVLDENYFHSYVSKENRLARKTRKIL